ncbi:MAG: ScbR family autoregulator-binding transcription factor [Specibacter sp.]
MCVESPHREGPAQTLQQRAKTTRIPILEGAALAFDEKGCGHASLSDVTERASTTKGALYFHFKSKEDLAVAVIEEQHRRVRIAAQDLAGTGGPALESIIGRCRLFAHQLLDDAVVRAGVRLTFESSVFNGDVKGPYVDWIDTVEALLRQAQAEGAARVDVDPASFARYLVAPFTGVQMVSNVLTLRRNVLQRIEEMGGYMLDTLETDAQ